MDMKQTTKGTKKFELVCKFYQKFVNILDFVREHLEEENFLSEDFHRENEIFVAYQQACDHRNSFKRICKKNYINVVNDCLIKFKDADVKGYWFRNLLREDLARLHSTIGDDLMLHVLSDCSIFILCDDQSCLVQISGDPISKLGFPKAASAKFQGAAGSFTFGRLVSRQWILYSHDFRCQFPAKKFLHLVDDVDKAADELCKSIQELRVHDDGTVEYVKYHFVGLKGVLKNFLIMHRNTRFRHMLNYHCRAGRRLSTKWKLGDLLQKHLTYQCVTKFLRAVCHNVVSDDFIGAKNLQKLRKKLSLIVEAGKTDQLRLGSFIEGLKISEVHWLSKNGQATINYKDRMRIFAQVVCWTLKYFLTILMTFFYITESNSSRYKLFYYRKDLWQSLLCLEMKSRIAEESLQHVEQGLYFSRMQTRSYIGNARLRFLPKDTILRPVVHVRSSENTKIALLKMRNVAVILAAIVQLSRVYGRKSYQEIHGEWRRFKHAVRLKKNVYFVKVDVKDCFGSIIHEKMLRIVEDLLDKHFDNCSVVRKLWKIRVNDEKITKQLINKAGQEINCLVEEAEASFSNCEGSVICPAKEEIKMTKAEVLYYVNMYITKMMVWVAGKTYLVHKGLIQGGFLSSTLCQLYLADIERRYLVQELAKSRKDTLMSVMDDFLFVTSSKTKAEKFLRTMNEGYAEYGIHVNNYKTRTNFVPVNDESVIVVESLKWYGLKINTKSLEMSVNYDRYLKIPIKYTLQFDELNAGERIRQKLLLMTKSQSHGILFCTSINSKKNISSNVYHLFVITAIRLHALVLRLPKHRRCSNTTFFVRLIESLVVIISRKLKKNVFSADEVRWLAFTAFHAILKKYATVYVGLIACLKQAKDQLLLCVEASRRTDWQCWYGDSVDLPFSDIK